jgi:hypothetical protein
MIEGLEGATLGQEFAKVRITGNHDSAFSLSAHQDRLIS